MCTAMCTGICTDMCVDMCTDMCADECIELGADMCLRDVHRDGWLWYRGCVARHGDCSLRGGGYSVLSVRRIYPPVRRHVYRYVCIDMSIHISVHCLCPRLWACCRGEGTHGDGFGSVCRTCVKMFWCTPVSQRLYQSDGGTTPP